VATEYGPKHLARDLKAGWDEVAAQASHAYYLASVLQNLWDTAEGNGERRVWLAMQGVPAALTKSREKGLLPPPCNYPK
jgi:hypothetical protein